MSLQRILNIIYKNFDPLCKKIDPSHRSASCSYEDYILPGHFAIAVSLHYARNFYLMMSNRWKNSLKNN
jgi:hypothetical protein